MLEIRRALPGDADHVWNIIKEVISKGDSYDIVGEIPEAFDHKENGLTNAYIMYRKLWSHNAMNAEARRRATTTPGLRWSKKAMAYKWVTQQAMPLLLQPAS